MVRTKLAVKTIQATRKHVLLIVFWVLVAHIAAIAQFSRGFLLTRPVLSHESNATINGAPTAPFSRAVVLVVDALRHDFVETPVNAPADLPYLRHFPVQDISADPRHAFTLKFMADPPTTTLQRLKGLTTGSLPAFVDAGSNFAGFKIEEDNWVSQAANNLGPVAFVGDDTWDAIFSHAFSQNFPFPSLNVRDLDTVDNGVKQHLPHMIRNTSNKVMIGHMLGVDHVGHRFGPAHPTMTTKLDATFEFVREIVQLIDDDTVLFVFGDHGMDQTGNHGGDSQDELEAALWVYSKRPAFSGEGELTVNQIDLVPTISALLGLPIPFNSLGFPIRQAFGDEKLWNFVTGETLTQLTHYADQMGMTHDMLAAQAIAGSASTTSASVKARIFQEYLLAKFKAAWIQFDLKSMKFGLALLIATTVLSLVLYNASRAASLGQTSFYLTFGGLIGGVCGGIASFVNSEHQLTLLGAAINTGFYAGSGSVLTGMLAALKLVRVATPSPWSYFALFVLGLEIAISFSNSFVIWESQILHMLLASVFVALAGCCAHQGSSFVMYLGGWYALLTLTVLRLSASWVVCREETASRCLTTFFEPGSSLVPVWTLFAIGIVGVVFPYFLKRFWAIGQNDVGLASLLLNMTSLAMTITITYWSLDNAEARGWLDASLVGLQTVKVVLGRLSLAMGFGGLIIWWRSNPPVAFVLNKETGIPTKINGFNNIHGADVLLTAVCTFWTLTVTNKPPAILALSALLYITLSTLDFLDITMTKYTLLVPVIFDLLGNSFFYFTGHQATIPSIQWDTAFIASSTVAYPWSPLTVTLNTLGPIILSGVVGVFSSLWRRPLFKDARMPMAFIVRAAMGLTFVTSCRTIAAMIASYILRRHLMTWKIFAPRFMFGAIALVTTDIACLFAVVLGGHTVKKVTELFG